MLYPNGSETVLSPGPWSELVAVRNCPCDDGVRRCARITGQPDTYCTAPASVKVRGKTVTGRVMARSGAVAQEGFVFIATKSGTNAAMIKIKERESHA